MCEKQFFNGSPKPGTFETFQSTCDMICQRMKAINIDQGKNNRCYSY